jgi:hypothetical protein
MLKDVIHRHYTSQVMNHASLYLLNLLKLEFARGLDSFKIERALP